MPIREIESADITKTVKELCVKANKQLPPDLCSVIKCFEKSEENVGAKDILNDMLKNLDAAKELNLPICQDTGMAVVFVELGNDVHIKGDLLDDAINKGVELAYTGDYLRCSVVADPIARVNTDNNTPAVIHLKMVKGANIKITVAPKGFGSENMSKIKMFNPSASEQDIISFVEQTVKDAGGNPCPPVVVGVGIGSDFEGCAILSKKALCRSISKEHPDPYYRSLEEKMLSAINSLNIGPQGFGGKTTALAVNIEVFATHIAGLPVAVNMGCHVTRHAEKLI